MCLGFRLFQKQRLSRLVLETAGADRQKESHYCSGEKDACALLQVADIRRVLRPSSGAFAKSIARAITAVSILSFVSFSVKSGSVFSCTFLQIRFHATVPLCSISSHTNRPLATQRITDDFQLMRERWTVQKTNLKLRMFFLPLICWWASQISWGCAPSLNTWPMNRLMKQSIGQLCRFYLKACSVDTHHSSRCIFLTEILDMTRVSVFPHQRSPVNSIMLTISFKSCRNQSSLSASYFKILPVFASMSYSYSIPPAVKSTS